MTRRVGARLIIAAALISSAPPSLAQPAPQGPPGGRPPPQAFADCQGKAAGDSVMHATPAGTVAATCVDSPDGLVARPGRGPSSGASGQPERWQQPDMPGRPLGQSGYNLQQAVSDRAQLTTIAFNGLAFITGGYGASTFIPPGKVADFFGFQYMRDIDAAGRGHSPQFLDRVAGNVLSLLDASQLQLFKSEAASEAEQMRSLALRRLPMIAAFHDQLDGRVPAGSTGLNRDAVMRYGGAMFEADAALAYQRAAVFGRLVATLSAQQKASSVASYTHREQDAHLARGVCAANSSLSLLDLCHTYILYLYLYLYFSPQCRCPKLACVRRRACVQSWRRMWRACAQ